MNTRRKWLIAGIAAGLVVALGGVATAYAASPEIPRGVSVLGIKLGGKTKAEAAAALREGLAPRLNEPITAKIEDRQTEILPQDVGLAVDVDATVERAADRHFLLALLGLTRVDPVITVDEKRLHTALKPAADGLGAPATMPGVRFEGLTPHPVYPVPGKGVHPSQAATLVAQAWLRKSEVDIPIVDVAPVSTAADVDRVLAELALPAVSAPVTITTHKGDLAATPERIAASLVIDSDYAGRLTPHVDETALRAALQPDLDKVEVAPKSATVGDGRILASQGGMVVDTARLAADLMPVLTRADRRTLAAVYQPVEPERTSNDLAALGIKEQVSTFTTYFGGGLNSPRSNNIITGAKKVDGAIVKPGETFSLNGFTGPRGYEQGYKDAPIIMNGKLTPGVGGGMSQFTTTLFNAAYYAGLEDVEHQPHTIYFSTYPSVIEATIFYPNLDLKFRNDTPYGILIDTSYTSGSITISMWSTKVYDSVTTEWGPRRDYEEPDELTVKAGPACIARPGSQGYRQDAWRVFHKDGKQIKREKFTWRYDAEPRVVCK